jgi:hypothetical protein
MERTLRRTALSLTIAAALIGCAGSSTGPPVTGGLSASAPAQLHVYSNRGAIVYPKNLLPGVMVPHPTAVEYLLEIAGVDGASRLEHYVGWTQVQDFELIGLLRGGANLMQPGGAHLLPAIRLTITKMADVSSPYILGSVYNGVPFKGADPGGGRNVTRLDVVDISGAPVTIVVFEFKNPTAAAFTSTSTGQLPEETVAINGDGVQMCVYGTLPGGGRSATPTCTIYGQAP